VRTREGLHDGLSAEDPVDYNHASTTTIRRSKLRAQGMVPKAGDVLELRARAQRRRLHRRSQSRGREAERAKRPHARRRAQSRSVDAVEADRARARRDQGREYTELSITFDEDLPHNVDERGQGFGLWAVALLNTPFLDDMLPVAASRDTDQPPARERPASREGSMKN
jgi:hypothetical protein